MGRTRTGRTPIQFRNNATKRTLTKKELGEFGLSTLSGYFDIAVKEWNYSADGKETPVVAITITCDNDERLLLIEIAYKNFFSCSRETGFLYATYNKTAREGINEIKKGIREHLQEMKVVLNKPPVEE